MSIEDVAKLAGVSTATVSRVLNGVGKVTPRTQALVRAAAAELKYSPNMHARVLAGAAAKSFGLVVSNLSNPFFADLFHALEHEASQNGYELFVADTADDPARLIAKVQLMLDRRVAGLALVVSDIPPKLLAALSERNVRTVVSPTSHYRSAIHRLVEYLFGLGHRRLAFIGPNAERRRAFIDAASRLEHRIVSAGDSFNGGRQAVRELFASGMRPTALVCANDFIAVGVLRELREMNINVPADISVTGFDNISLSEMLSPSLTTVYIPSDLLGRKIFHMLTGKDEPQHDFVIDPELVLRESTGPVA